VKYTRDENVLPAILEINANSLISVLKLQYRAFQKLNNTCWNIYHSQSDVNYDSHFTIL